MSYPTDWKIGTERPRPKISCIFHTSENRGDHAADIAIALDVAEGETVESLVSRTLIASQTNSLGPSDSPTGKWGVFDGFFLNHADRIELRIVREAPVPEVPA